MFNLFDDQIRQQKWPKRSESLFVYIHNFASSSFCYLNPSHNKKIVVVCCFNTTGILGIELKYLKIIRGNDDGRN